MKKQVVVIPGTAGVQATEYEPALELYRWPLEVGKKWSFDLEVTSGAQRRRQSVDVVVEAYEEIAVAAGIFRAFKVRARSDGEEYLAWYAPSVKNLVREERRFGGRVGGAELHYFSPATPE